MQPQDVIVAPVVTEKTAEDMEQRSIYTFVVSQNANKIEIGKAVERLWDVSVTDVRTMRYPAKARRSFLGRMAKSAAKGKRASYKKAVVQLAQGEHIEFYEVG